MRRSGILLPISSLSSKYGIGSFSKEAFHFVDFLAKSKQKLWQILPLGPTGYGDSPYQAFSTFAGNPYFIDLEALIEEGLLTKDECKILEDDSRKIDCAKQFQYRFPLLKKAYERYKSDKKEEAYNSAQEILKKALAGNDMSMLATEYSDDPRVAQDGGKYTFKRGEGLGEVIDKVVFEEAEVGKVYPKVVKTDMGYEVLKVLSVETESQES